MAYTGLYTDLLTNYGYDRLVSTKGEVNKKLIYDTLMASVLKKAQMMLKYDNLPEEIPERMLKIYLITNGHFAGFSHNGKMMISWGTFAGKPDEYYMPKQYIVSNPYIEGMSGRTLQIGTDCIVVKNDSMAQPLLDVISKHVNMLTENESSMIICDILARAQGLLSAKDDTQFESAKEYLKNIFNGKVLPIKSENWTGENMDSIPFGTAHYILTDLIEYEQYIRSSLYAELGIKINFNMKRESLNAEETSMDEEILKPYIDNMIETQNEDLLMLSDFWGLQTPITCRRGSVWEENEKKDEIQMEIMEAQAEAAETAAEAPEEAPEEAPAESPTEPAEESTEEEEKENED